MMIPNYDNVKLFKDKKYIYLVNLSYVSIECLILSTFSTQIIDDNTIIKSAQPFFSIKDVSARSYFELEDIDPYKEGAIRYIAEMITWADGLIEESITLRPPRMVYKLRAGSIDLNTFTKINREQVLIKTIK